MNTNFFDVNELCRRLREAYPVAWTVLATLGNIIRSAARAYFPILVCMIVTNYLLGEILELAHIEMTRFVLPTAAPNTTCIAAVTVWSAPP